MTVVVQSILAILIVAALIVAVRQIKTIQSRRLRAKLDARVAFIERYVFPASLRHKLRARFPDMDDAKLDLIFAGLRQWFILLARNPRQNFGMPSVAVDTAWHEFILFTRGYEAFCQQAFGRFLHHAPNEGNADEAQSALARTYAQGPTRIAAAGAGAMMGAAAAAPMISSGLFGLDRVLGLSTGSTEFTSAELDALMRRGTKDQQSASSNAGCGGGFSAGCVGVTLGGSKADGANDGGGDSGGGGDGGGSGCGGGCGSS
ncbi:MAG: hypothetical protein EAZ43_12240 [Betaproteobacteria bacterium]|nr:MAG: hypothetical protein EAZ43_12240 [Betaproteobacteria bacterium]